MMDPRACQPAPDATTCPGEGSSRRVGAAEERTLPTTVRRAIGAAAAVCAAAFALASPARAQVFTGRIDVTVADPSGAHIPGVSVEVSGPEAQTLVTDAQGQAHFLSLPVGIYAVKLTLAGFAPYTSSNVEVTSGASTALDVKLELAGASETVNVIAVTPAVDVRRAATTVNLSLAELQELPNARDPWALLATVPTVYSDRVNVGGSESGQQANYNAKGAQNTDNAWTIDGVPVTDMGDNVMRPRHASGASSFYYDFDTVQEMAITTGGADAQNATSGVQVNVVLRKGTNLPHGSLRYFYENKNLQSVNISSDLAAALGDTTGKGNRTDGYHDYGFDLGGPLLKDSSWIWGAMGRTAIDLLTLTGSSDNTSFNNTAFKAEGRLNNDVRGNFAFYDNSKKKDGRDAGPTRPPETTWNQTGPSRYYKGEGDLVVRKGLFASVKGAYIDAGFELIPVGGLAKDYYIDAGGVAHNTYYQYQTSRPQRYFGGDASYFAGHSEVKFGASWRRTSADTRQTWPASHLVATWDNYPNMLVQVARDYHAATTARYLSAYASDTLSLDRATLTAGLRFDRQTSSLAASSVPAVAGFETVLPAVTAAPQDDVFQWTSVTPRVAASYALDAARKTVVRGSYAMFASQLPGSLAAFVSPIQYSYAYYNAVDRNGDGVAQASEVLVNQGLQGFYGFDPRNPLRSRSINAVSADMKPPVTHELVVGVDKEFAPDLAASATFTYRRMKDLLWTPLIGVTRASYTQTGTLTGAAPEVGSFSVPLYALNVGALPPGGGKVSANRPGYHQRFVGLELSLVKRLSHRWMARAGFSTNDWREYFDDPAVSILDPTRAPAPSTSLPFTGPQEDGGPVVRQSSGSGKSGIYMIAPAFQLVANGTYDAIWGIMLGANLVTRQGYAEPFFSSNVPTGDPLGRKTVLIVQHVDDFRLPSVTSFDMRAEKKFTFGTAKIAVDVDIFNLFNSGTVLGRQYDVRLTGATGFGQVLEIMNPRIARIGVRFVF
jgi:hypothetical protein